MKKLCLWMLVVCGVLGFGFSLLAQESGGAKDIAGTWQGSIPEGGKQLRLVVKITKADAGLKATLYSIDQGGQPFNASSISFQGGTLKEAFGELVWVLLDT
jgi:hypothetical protein